MLRQSLLLLYLSFLFNSGKGQIVSLQHTDEGASANSALSFYHPPADKQSRLYNGREYTGYPSRYIGTAYFISGDWQNGTVTYDGITYQEVPMKYDEVKDEVIIRHFNNITNLSLVSEKVSGFSFSGHTFVRLKEDSIGQSAIRTGFYDRLYNGAVMVLAKRTKLIKDYTISQQIETRFDAKEEYYIKKNGVYHAVNTKGALLHILNDRKKEVQQYVRRNKIRFKKAPESAIVKAAAYYDSLKK